MSSKELSKSVSIVVSISILENLSTPFFKWAEKSKVRFCKEFAANGQGFIALFNLKGEDREPAFADPFSFVQYLCGP